MKIFHQINDNSGYSLLESLLCIFIFSILFTAMAGFIRVTFLSSENNLKKVSFIIEKLNDEKK